jgi:GST-like protein
MHHQGGAHCHESVAILLYLADKTRQFIPRTCAAKRMPSVAVLANGRSGPHGWTKPPLIQYAPEKLPGPLCQWTSGLYGVLNKHLSDGRAYICGDYSIADVAAIAGCSA